MKKIKNLILILFVFIFSRPLFADGNIRWNTVWGPTSYQGSLIVNYEFEYEENKVMAVGLEGGFLIPHYYSPYFGMNASWIKCIQPESQKKYRLYFEPELHGGIKFWNTYYINPNGQEIKNSKRSPFITTDVLFTLKPTTWGFYGGIGPSLSFTTYKMDGKREYKVLPALFLTFGIRFDEF